MAKHRFVVSVVRDDERPVEERWSLFIHGRHPAPQHWATVDAALASAAREIAAVPPAAKRRTEVPSTPVRKSPSDLDAMPGQGEAPLRGATQATRFCADCGSAYWTARCLCGVE